MSSRAVVLLSGGLDSATVLAIAKSQGYECFALTMTYGQRHMVELEAAKRVAAAIGVSEHVVISVPLDAWGGSSLTDLSMAVPKSRSESELEHGIPNTYVPARNLIFLSLAAGYAEAKECHHIFLGVNALDYSGYPDCRNEFIQAFEKAAQLGTKAGVEGGSLTIHRPLIAWTKKEIIQTGLSLGIDYGMTHSCYDPSLNGTACGQCDSCLIRKSAFQELGLVDPVLTINTHEQFADR